MSRPRGVDDVVAICRELPGWADETKIRRMYELAHQTGGLSVELGVFGGRVLIAMAFAHALLGRGYALGLDPWSNAAVIEGAYLGTGEAWWSSADFDALFAGFQETVRKHRLGPFCRWQRIKSCDATVEGPIMLLHQDGNHSDEVTLEEVSLYAPKIPPGGYWVADDSDWPTTRASTRELVENRGFELVEDHPNWAIFRKL